MDTSASHAGEPPALPLTSTSASAFARYASTRARLRKFRRAQTIGTALCCVLAAVAWLDVVELNWRGGVLVAVPLVVAASAGAVFFRRLWPAVFVRATLWASLLICSVVALGSTGNKDAADAMPVALAAGIGLLSLGRFSRSLGGARPLLVALAALAIADACTHGAIATMIVVDTGLREGDADVHSVVAFFGYIAVANIIGLACILKSKGTLVWPHALLNGVVIVLVAVDVVGAPLILNVVIGAAALLQIALAVLLKAPPAPPHVRRAGEIALRVAIVLTLLADIVAAAV